MSETQTQTLSAWLLERIAEDEAVARGAIDAQTNGRWSDEEGDPTGFGFTVALPLTFVEHAARHDPARVLAECEAKRRIVEWHHPSNDHGERYDPYCVGCWEDGGEDGAPSYPCRTLRWLALPYADRPGFQEEWRP